MKPLTEDELKQLEWEVSDDDDAPDMCTASLVLRLIAEVRALRKRSRSPQERRDDGAVSDGSYVEDQHVPGHLTKRRRRHHLADGTVTEWVEYEPAQPGESESTEEELHRKLMTGDFQLGELDSALKVQGTKCVPDIVACPRCDGELKPDPPSDDPMVNDTESCAACGWRGTVREAWLGQDERTGQ